MIFLSPEQVAKWHSRSGSTAGKSFLLCSSMCSFSFLQESRILASPGFSSSGEGDAMCEQLDLSVQTASLKHVAQLHLSRGLHDWAHLG